MDNDKNVLSVSYTNRHILDMDSNEDNICIRCFISGVVQGVFFRASTREQALQLNITGYAKNLANGDVEIIACGVKNNIDQLRQWLIKGPKYAEVKNINCKSIDLDEIEDLFMNNFRVL